MKIGIISDTHSKVGRAKKAIDHLVQSGAEYLMHAGDICEVEVLEYMKESKLPYIAVYGNNDAHMVPYHRYFNLVQEPHIFTIEDYSFKLMHMPYYMNPDADIVIFGHTHIFECDYKEKTLFLNPGEVCARNKPTSECLMLNIEQNLYKIEYYTRTIKQSLWQTQHIYFEIKEEN